MLYQIPDYGGGYWSYDPFDHVSSDNTGTVLVTPSGQRLKRVFSGPLNVKWFGALGDGFTDDQPAITKALQAAHAQKADLYFPTGNYLCNTIDEHHHILTFDAGNTTGLTIYGDSSSGSRLITTLDSTSILFYTYAYLKCQQLSIRNLGFENRHGIITHATQAIFIQGTKGENFENVAIDQCSFQGFSNAIGAQGVNGCAISGNLFTAPRGHDNAQNNTSPAVYIWFFDNKNGYCSDVRIENNRADGYSGTDPIYTLATRRAMDGFLYGTAYGYTVIGNYTKNFSEEHIAIAPPATFPEMAKPIMIADNHIDASIPEGSVDPNGKIHAENYAIRCEANNVVITGNEIINYTTGVLVRGVDHPAFKMHSLEIAGNTLTSAKDNGLNKVKAGIFVQGGLNNRIRGIRIHDNTIHADNLIGPEFYNGILLYDSDSALVQNNKIYVTDATGKTNAFGISYGRSSGVNDQSNTIIGIKPYRLLSAEDSVEIFHKKK